MILSSVIIVLREVLEAALLISLLLALSHFLRIPSRWLLVAIAIGLIGAALYAHYLGPISDWFDGTGQEIVNAVLQIVLAIMLLVCVPLWILRKYFNALTLCMTASITMAIVREGSEIVVYVSGFMSSRELFLPVLLGGAIGLGIGASVGALTYFALSSLEQRPFTIAVLSLSALVAAGFTSQAMNLLIQADWLTATNPVWDSSSWLPEDTVVGQLLYALIGYEATPTLIQVLVYSSVIVGFAVVSAICYRQVRPAPPTISSPAK